MENNKEIVVEEVKVVEETAVVEAKKSWLAKPKAFLQKHGKKALVVTLVAAGTVAGYALGKQSGSNSVDNDDYDYLQDGNDDYDSEVKVTEF